MMNKFNNTKTTHNKNSEPEENLIPNFKLFNKNFYHRSAKQRDPLADTPAELIHYKNLDLLKKFISQEKGKIVPSRISGTSSKKQRLLKKAIKQARQVALLL